MTITFKQQGNGVKSWIVDGQLTYDSPTNTYHNNMLQGYLDELNYLSIGEVVMWVNDTKYGAEAQSIINWWIPTCKLVAEYVDLHPNEETAEEFILTIPTLTL
jgi:hypothetical protein